MSLLGCNVTDRIVVSMYEMFSWKKKDFPFTYMTLVAQGFILFAASAFRKLSSIYVFSYFPFGFEGRIWDLIVSVPDHCLSFYYALVQHKMLKL